jgi:crotonobetainyl-CoA:carnitine CoA-transferase CaiB-like acyl-CoA transferase
MDDNVLNMTAPLDGIRILDLSRILAGPYCTMILGDLGADVVKIEQPDGDDTRRWGPPFSAGESAYFLSVNRNKRSVTVDLKSADGAALIRRIAHQVDVLVENFKPGTLERLGLSLADLRRQNSRLITLSITGTGIPGADNTNHGYDFIVQASGGLMSISGPEEGPPCKTGIAIVDITTGMMGANAILAALYSREKTGRGQHIDISLLETQISWLANVGEGYLVSGDGPARYGNAHPNIVPYQLMQARDGYFALAAGNDLQWRRLCSALKRDDLAQDSRFSTNPQRVTNRELLIKLLNQHFATDYAAHWVKLMSDAGVPAGDVRTIPQALNDPQVLARDMVVTVKHPTIGDLKLLGIPFKFSNTPATIRRPPPLLGEHTDDVLREFGK